MAKKKKTVKRVASKKHTCLGSYCVCRHPSFLIALVTLIITSFGIIYFTLVR